MNKIVELYGKSVSDRSVDWDEVVRDQLCPFSGKKCYKVRKSTPDVSIGTCVVHHFKDDVIICPNRLMERKQVFMDCIHLLTKHEPGNELHLISEVKVPGGTVDFILVSLKRGSVVDFAGIEFQALDTIGSVWPERQRLLKELGLKKPDSEPVKGTPLGMNWKMTAKTILVQMHHKAKSFESMGKHLVLVVQCPLLGYIQKEFDCTMFRKPVVEDPVHIHSYSLEVGERGYNIQLDSRLSTDSQGIMRCLGLNADTSIDVAEFERFLLSKVSEDTLLTI